MQPVGTAVSIVCVRATVRLSTVDFIIQIRQILSMESVV